MQFQRFQTGTVSLMYDNVNELCKNTVGSYLCHYKQIYKVYHKHNTRTNLQIFGHLYVLDDDPMRKALGIEMETKKRNW